MVVRLYGSLPLRPPYENRTLALGRFKGRESNPHRLPAVLSSYRGGAAVPYGRDEITEHDLLPLPWRDPRIEDLLSPTRTDELDPLPFHSDHALRAQVVTATGALSLHSTENQ